jgi:hypothetical protein
MLLLPLGLATAVAVLALLVSRKSSPTTGASAESQDPGSQSSLYRVTVRVSPQLRERLRRSSTLGTGTLHSRLSRALSDRLKLCGFASVLLATADPTDCNLWSFLARKGAGPLRSLPDFEIFTAAEAEEPPAPPRGHALPLLDVGLSEEEADSVLFALRSDEDTKHLGGFASTLEGEFPVSAALLHAKGLLALTRSTMPVGEPSEATGDKITPEQQRADEARKLLLSLSALTAPLGLGGMWEKYDDSLRTLARRASGRESWDELRRKLLLVLKLFRGPVAAAPLPISASALQLAFALRRPELSGVSDPDKLDSRLRGVSRSVKRGDDDGKAAQKVLRRANQLLERRSWTSWYKKSRQIEREERLPGTLTGGFFRQGDSQ